MSPKFSTRSKQEKCWWSRTIYPLLTRLKNGGLLSYRWEESASGPPRKYYVITDAGKEFLSELDGTWNELKEAVNLVTQIKK